MAPASAIRSYAPGSRSGTAKAKQEALEAKGVRVGESPTEAAQIAVETLRAL